MKSSTMQPSSTTSFSWRMLAFFLIVFAAFQLLPTNWHKWATVALLAFLLLYCIAESAFTFARSRWYFRVAANVTDASVAAIMIWLRTQPSGQWQSVAMTSGALGAYFFARWVARRIEQRLYPVEIAAFDNARTRAGTCGFLLFRHIPRIPRLTR